MPQTPLQTYFHELHNTHRSGAGVKETSYYPALKALFDEVGKTLKPKVKCIINLANRGAGLPDGGFFTPDQFQRGEHEPLQGTLPSRGALEVKGPTDDAIKISQGKQVKDYLARYGLVLVTNLRDFVLMKREDSGAIRQLERYTLAKTETEFWQALSDPAAFATQHEERLGEYLRRAMLHAAPLSRPEDVAWFLASYARDARSRIEAAKQLPALDNLRKALEQGLGLSFEGDKGEHFFRSTLVQTLFYGLFSAWVLWCEEHEENEKFDWRSAEWELHLPVIRELFSQLSVPDKLRPLGLVEVMDWSGAVLNRVQRAEFFTRFEQNHAVRYFYEPFLQAYDPELRKQFGVWYTPPEVVHYMVERVDRALRTELGLERGLADDNVYVLDPCTGTGSYVVEVLRRIHQTLQEEGGADALSGQRLKEVAMKRVFGFEIMPAPFVVAHLQIGLLLRQLESPMDENQRPAVYLTNALTGWDESTDSRQPLAFPGLEEERDSARGVKQGTPIIVIIGNPPYNAFAGLAIDEERDLANAYRTTKKAPKPRGHGLNDLYVRFFRMAERRIVERTGRGVLCYISNYSWLEGFSHTGMRERYLEVFDQVWIDNLNGDKFKTGKVAPDGSPDPSIFSTETNREGIGIGTAIAMLARNGDPKNGATVHYREFWGRNKRQDLLSTLNQAENYEVVSPVLELGLPFQPTGVDKRYFDWPLLADLFVFNSPGVNTSRDVELVSIEIEPLRRRMGIYFDPKVSDEQIEQIASGLMTPSGRFDPQHTRKVLIAKGLNSGKFVQFDYRPLETRWLYWHPETKLLDEKRDELFDNLLPNNRFLICRPKSEREWEGSPFLFIKYLADRHLTRPGSVVFPVWYKPEKPKTKQKDLFAIEEESGPEIKANLSSISRQYLARLGFPNPDQDRQTAELIWFHALAVGYSPAYLSEHADGIRTDWPRIPLPESKEALLASADLGRKVAMLLDTEANVEGVTKGKLRPELAAIAVVSRVGSGQLKPEELEVRAGWGRPDSKGVVMPGKGKYDIRPYHPHEAKVLDGLGLGSNTLDVYLNQKAFWRCVPERVWDYTIGGYQVVKKWLSYREFSNLGRPLTVEEASEVSAMCRRIAAILLLEPELDANYKRIVFL